MFGPQADHQKKVFRNEDLSFLGFQELRITEAQRKNLRDSLIKHKS